MSSSETHRSHSTNWSVEEVALEIWWLVVLKHPCYDGEVWVRKQNQMSWPAASHEVVTERQKDQHQSEEVEPVGEDRLDPHSH